MKTSLFIACFVISTIAGAMDAATAKTRMNCLWIWRNDIKLKQTNANDQWPSKADIKQVVSMFKSGAVLISPHHDNKGAFIFVDTDKITDKNIDRITMEFDVACMLFTPGWPRSGCALRLMGFNLKRTVGFRYHKLWISVPPFSVGNGLYKIEITQAKK